MEIMESETWRLFPTIVKQYKFEGLFSLDEIAFMESQEMEDDGGSFKSRNTFLLDEEPLSRVKTFVLKCMDDYIRTVHKPENDVKPYLTQSWLNYYDPLNYHHKHFHPNSFLSGVIYFSDTELRFFNNIYEPIEIKSKDYNIDNSNAWNINTSYGTVLIFPSHLQHSVPITTSPRYTIAFNSYISGHIGTSQNLMHLSL